MRGGRQYGNKRRTKTDMRAAAVTMLTMRQSLDGVTVETLVRSYGLNPVEATSMLDKEKDRRAANDVR